MKRRGGPLLWVLCLLFAGAALRPVYAHAQLVAAVPAPGSQLETPPEQIRLTFDQAIGGDSTLVVFDEGFRPAAGLRVRHEPVRPELLAAALAPLPPGRYTVQWNVISGDGDPASGSYAFDVLDVSSAGIGLGWTAAGVALVVVLTVVSGWARWRRRTRITEM